MKRLVLTLVIFFATAVFLNVQADIRLPAIIGKPYGIAAEK